MGISKSEKGFTMVEMLVAISILAFGIVGAWTAFAMLSHAEGSEALQVTGRQLAQEGIEIARSIRANNLNSGSTWDGGLNNCSAGCEVDYTTDTATQGQNSQLQAYSGRHLSVDQNGLYGYSCSN